MKSYLLLALSALLLLTTQADAFDCLASLRASKGICRSKSIKGEKRYYDKGEGLSFSSGTRLGEYARYEFETLTLKNSFKCKGTDTHGTMNACSLMFNGAVILPSLSFLESYVGAGVGYSIERQRLYNTAPGTLQKERKKRWAYQWLAGASLRICTLEVAELWAAVDGRYFIWSSRTRTLACFAGLELRY